MVSHHQLNILDNANKALQKAWERVQKARQGSNPLELQNSLMAYCQTLQRVCVATETAITTK